MGVSSRLLQPLCVSVTALAAATRLIQLGEPWRTSVAPFPDRAPLDGLGVRRRTCATAIDDDDPFLKQTPRVSSAARHLLEIAQIYGGGPACL